MLANGGAQPSAELLYLIRKIKNTILTKLDLKQKIENKN